MGKKFASRKFLLSVASVLGSIATAVAGYTSDNQTIMIIGVICGVASAAIYELLESMIDIGEINAEAEVEIAEIEESYFEDDEEDE